MSDIELTRASDIEPKALPCPACGKQMPYYGGSAGFIHCGFKILYRQGGWFDASGLHVKKTTALPEECVESTVRFGRSPVDSRGSA
jgi:hypothetical protein